ncbi:hypothetical protein HDU99_004960, partial [Rhizoclosmatium hyalinum]
PTSESPSVTSSSQETTVAPSTTTTCTDPVLTVEITEYDDEVPAVPSPTLSHIVPPLPPKINLMKKVKNH